MINIKFSNQASTTLVDPILSTDNTIVVKDALVFPTIAADEYFIVCVASSSAGYEIMKVVGVEDNTLTVVRAQEGTSVKDFPSGASVENRLTAGSLHSVIENASETVPHANENSTNIGQGSEILFGHVKITDDSASEATATLGIGISPYAMKTAFDKILGNSPELIFTASGNYTVPVTGTYRIIATGGGGTGGSSGYSVVGAYLFDPSGPSHGSGGMGGGGGGGGGSSQTITQNVVLTEGTVIPYTIGGPGGTTTFGTYVTALGGGNGGSGGNGGNYVSSWNSSGCPVNYSATGGVGGANGTSYGNAAQAGGTGAVHKGQAIAAGGAGGAGGISAEGFYGNGGRGATSPYRTESCGYTNGSAGQVGTQGCIKIKLAV